MRPIPLRIQLLSVQHLRKYRNISLTSPTQHSRTFPHRPCIEHRWWRHKIYKFHVSAVKCNAKWIFIFFNFIFFPAYTSDALLPMRDVQPPNELLNFIEKQENYIEQLEKESVFCRVSDQSYFIHSHASRHISHTPTTSSTKKKKNTQQWKISLTHRTN